MSVPATALAADPAEVALEAARVRDDLCSDAAGSDTTLAASVVNRVSAVWERVSGAYEESKQPFLLYWRGVLEQCLDQEERARDDLELFLLGSGEDATVAELVRDAKTRLRRLQAGDREPAPVAPAVVGGAATAAGAGLMAGLAGWQQEVSKAAEARYYSGQLTTPEFPFVEADAVEAARRRNALAVTAGALGAASVASFVVVATRASAGDDARRRPVLSVAPTLDGGVVVALAGRW